MNTSPKYVSQYFCRPISLENSRNPIMVPRVHFNSANEWYRTFRNLPATYLLSKIVLYIIYIITRGPFLSKIRETLLWFRGFILTLRTNDIVHFATYLLSKIVVLYIIYVIICTYMGINWHRRQQPMCLIYVGVNGTNCTYGLTSKQNKAHIYVGTVMEL